jgi:SAM-dependent methyltransferase
MVETFDGSALTGWVGSPDPDARLAVDIYADGRFVETSTAEAVRPDVEASGAPARSRGFRFQFSSPFCRVGGPLVLPQIPRLGVYWSGTDRQVPVARDLKGVVNVEDFGSSEAYLLFHDDRFQPEPDETLRAHVAGQGVAPADYRAVGKFVAMDLMSLGLLWPNSHIIDIGCGCGRVAAYLAPVLNRGGSYSGFDTWRRGIDWASREISPIYPNVRFQTLSRAGGKDPGYVGDAAYDIPLADESCDLVLCASLFTHLTFDAALTYLREIRRLIGHRGRAFVSCFILDEEAEEVLANHRLDADEYGKYARHEGFFDSYFRPEVFQRLFASSQLTPLIQRLGHWRGPKYMNRRPVGYQDLFILRAD